MTNMLFYAIKKILCFAKRVIKILLRVFLPNIIYSNLTCLRFFERIQIKNNSGTSKLVCVFGIPVLQYANIDGRRKYCLPAKKQIDKTQPVFYLKINRRDDYVFLCFQHWIDTIAEKGADYFIICDNKILEKEICKKIIFHDTNIKFLKSCKNRKQKHIVDKIATKYWIKATYAHLTTFYHAKNNGIASFWNIDADDTLFCMPPEKISNYLKEVEAYADKNDIEAFSLDMHRSRTRGRHWSFGITYTKMDTNWFQIFNENPDVKWHKHYDNYDYEFNLDWFFTFLKDYKNIKNETFYINNSLFIHWGNFLTNIIGSGIFYWKNNTLKFPIILEVIKDEYFGNIPISKDCIKFESDMNDEIKYKFIIDYVTYLYKPSKQMNNLWCE